MMKNIYKKMYSAEKGKLDLASNPRVKIMVNLVNKLNLENKNILDIGCYDGTFLSLIKNKNNFLYGVEASEYGMKECSRKGIKIKKFFFDDQIKFPLKTDFFDLIIAGEIIEHIYDTDFFLDEIYRLLKKDGFLLLSTPNIASLGRRLLLLMGVNPIIEASPNWEDSSGHIRYFTFDSLEQLLKRHKLENEIMISDVVNLPKNRWIRLVRQFQIFKGFGQSIICLCRKSE